MMILRIKVQILKILACNEMIFNLSVNMYTINIYILLTLVFRKCKQL